jgi:hypothetical protein
MFDWAPPRAEPDLAIFLAALNPATTDIPLAAMPGWKSAMRGFSAEVRLHLYARSLSPKTGSGIHTAAFYGAFVLIAAVVLGSLSVHPF